MDELKTIGSTIALFQIYLEREKRVSSHTSSSYVRDISLFFQEYPNILSLEAASIITLPQIQSFFHKQRNSHISISTLGRKLSSLKSFFRFTKKKFDITNENIFKIKSFKLKQTLPRAVEKETFLKLARIIKTTPKKEWEGLRDEALLYLIYSTGMRISEALSLKHSSLDRRTNSITIKGKGDKERIIVLHKDILKRISQYLEKIPSEIKTEYLKNSSLPLQHMNIFLSKTGKKYTPRMFQLAISAARNSIGLSSSLTPHSMRHSFASHILENGGKIRVIQEILGHSSLKTTQKYLKVSDAALEAAYNKFH